MSNKVYKFPDHELVTATACEWLARLDRGLSEQEERELGGWLRESPAHARSLIEVAGLWDRMDSLSRLSELFPTVTQARGAPRRLARRSTWAIAASLILAVAVALIAITLPRTRQPAAYESSDASLSRAKTAAAHGYRHQFQTAVGERSRIGLPDGSELMLNTNSRVYVDFSDGMRKLTLEQGELYIRVAHDALHPLTVRAGDKVVRALGTEFNVEIAQNQHVEVLVTQGKVLIGVAPEAADSSNAGHARAGTPVVAGQRILLGEEEQVIKEVNADEITVKLSWRDGKIIFRGEPLAVALSEIERYTPVEFIIQDENLKTIRVAGLFKAGDVEGLLATLKQNFNISYERTAPDKIVLKSN